MTITLKTSVRVSSPELRKFAPPSMANFADQLDPAQGNIFNDLTSGCVGGTSITGPSRARAAGRDLVISGSADRIGLLTVECSLDGGATWPVSDSERIPGSEAVVARAVLGASYTHYRIRFSADAGHSSSRVNFFTQART